MRDFHNAPRDIQLLVSIQMSQVSSSITRAVTCVLSQVSTTRPEKIGMTVGKNLERYLSRVQNLVAQHNPVTVGTMSVVIEPCLDVGSLG